MSKLEIITLFVKYHSEYRLSMIFFYVIIIKIFFLLYNTFVDIFPWLFYYYLLIWSWLRYADLINFLIIFNKLIILICSNYFLWYFFWYRVIFKFILVFFIISLWVLINWMAWIEYIVEHLQFICISFIFVWRIIVRLISRRVFPSWDGGECWVVHE